MDKYKRRGVITVECAPIKEEYKPQRLYIPKGTYITRQAKIETKVNKK